MKAADYTDFTIIQHPDHCILHAVKECSADLMPKRHQYLLRQAYDIYRKSFVPRCLLLCSSI